jgi:hypothetical protein
MHFNIIPTVSLPLRNDFFLSVYPANIFARISYLSILDRVPNTELHHILAKGFFRKPYNVTQQRYIKAKVTRLQTV